MKALLEAGKVVPVIDQHYWLSEVSKTIRYLEERNHQGKIVIIYSERPTIRSQEAEP